MKIFAKFTTDESGGITVEWVVLTAGLIAIAMAVIAVISSGLETVARNINTELSSRFTTDESGAATADWVALTAALIAIAISVSVLISNGS